MKQTRDDLLYVLLDNLYFRECRFSNTEANAEGRALYHEQNRSKYAKMTKERIQDAIDMNFPQSESKNSQRQL